ncbi:MAG: nucleoside triphosphate pyrophosphohydrolase [Sphingomonadales bacterium]|nr:nucleoside triphosphate pyrophosphohydrolase [Sphingomonadales bacterium]
MSIKNYQQSFERLVSIMEELREKCPWDQKQTIESLRSLTIEETFELADSITEQNYAAIKEELGDLLLHIVFYAKIGAEQRQFELNDVIESICNKLVHRHPHIYGNVVVNSEEEVKRNWEQLKLKEGKTSVLQGVPRSLPATIKALRLQEKAKQVGFEWDHREQVWDKVQEEMLELKEAITQAEQEGHQEKIEEEFGDLVFSLINYARFLKIDPETALERTNKKFIHRFTLLEKEAALAGRMLAEMTLAEMDAIWNQIKQRSAS